MFTAPKAKREMLEGKRAAAGGKSDESNFDVRRHVVKVRVEARKANRVPVKIEGGGV